VHYNYTALQSLTKRHWVAALGKTNKS